jgi:hypothetical protein
LLEHEGDLAKPKSSKKTKESFLKVFCILLIGGLGLLQASHKFRLVLALIRAINKLERKNVLLSFC